MLRRLQISDPWERGLVRVADAAIAPVGWVKPPPSHGVRRVLLLRLERIGDLVMALEGLATVRAALPDAEIDLVVGSWNASLASLIPGITHVAALDAPWLSRGKQATTWAGLIRAARAWRTRNYDLAINFEPDIRSNFLLWIAGAARRVGYWTAGGGAFLTDAAAYDPSIHVAANAVNLARLATGGHQPESGSLAHARLATPDAARRQAASVLGDRSAPLVGVHTSGGRAIKQWPPERFGALARQLVDDLGATIVLTGGESDRDLVNTVKAALPPARVIDLCGSLDLQALAAVIERLDLLITGDTGPMHVAHAVGTPTVSIFGPSDRVRYGGREPHHRIVRVDLPCSPCNRIRRPPARCTGHTPDCLAGVSVDLVRQAVDDALAERRTCESRRARALG
jgi:lipopolysaccharide heptosyltransferase II